ncbi:unnamed protein product [Orchesella dallaii]|uniref:Uncharacterized protein n=1 Tax=Orchesella dallaii TaxID=48710 RepID=A0ABP1S4V2_9HEXA
MDKEGITSDCAPLMSDDGDYANRDRAGTNLIGDLNEIESDGDDLPEDHEEGPVLKYHQDPITQLVLPLPPVDTVPGIITSKACGQGQKCDDVAPRFSSIMSPIVQPFRKIWRSLVYQRRKKSVKNLARRYCLHLMSILSDDCDSFPQQAKAIFESLLQSESEMPFNNERKAGVINLEDSPLQKTTTISLFAGEAMMKLSNFLEASLKMGECITSICALLNQALNEEFMIEVNTKEHELCVLFVRRLFTLLQRLDALSTRAVASFQKFLGSSLLHGILLLPDMTNFDNLNCKMLTNIFPSTVATIETLCLTSIGAVIRLSAFICSMLSHETLDNFETKVGNLANDVTISIQEFYNAVNSSRQDYCSKKTSLACQHQPTEPSHASSISKFSREYKIFKQYEDIHRLSNELAERFSTAQDLANELMVNVLKDSKDESDELADRIAMEHAAASEIYKKLMDLMEIQNLLVEQLNSKPHHQLESTSDTLPSNLEIRTEVETVSEEMNSETEEIPKNEFESGPEDLENANTIENRDEVFIAIFTGEDEDREGTNDWGRLDGGDKKLVKQSYSRLITELKGSIGELLQNTKRREKEAQKTIYGNAQLDLDLIENLQTNESGARKELKEVGNLNKYLVTSDDDHVNHVPFCPVTPISIVNELNAKIKQRHPAAGLGLTDCIGDESSSGSDLSDND